ncbi:MAG: hypothetical protein PHO02_03710 [Candidatus Nanoarchaeia archaeon]|nr:hypothetical protein [Candidatus Nanoarchaeia archaeon]
MRQLSEILNDYFASRDLASDELNEVLACRERSIAKAASHSLPSTTSYAMSFDVQMELMKRHIENAENILKSSIRGRRAIELGPGCNPLQKWLLERGASEYTGVEMLYPQVSEKMVSGENAKIVKSDALSFLVSQPDESAIVASRGVLNDEVMPSPNYARFLIREIYRVTPKGAVTIHSMGVSSLDENRFFREAGFKPLDDKDYNAVWIK